MFIFVVHVGSFMRSMAVKETSASNNNFQHPLHEDIHVIVASIKRESLQASSIALDKFCYSIVIGNV